MMHPPKPTRASLRLSKGPLSAELLERRDCPAVVSIASPGSVDEAAGVAVLEVTLSEPLPVIASVVLAPAPSTARAGVDYQIFDARGRATRPGPIVFAPGETKQLVPLRIWDDLAREGDETIAFVLSNPRNCSLGQTRADITIIDDDVQTAEAQPFSASVPEGTPFRFSVTLSAPATKTERFFISTTSGTARAGRDFADIPRRPVFVAPGQTGFQFDVRTLNDAIDEPNESFSVRVESLTPGLLRPTVMPVTITPPPILVSANDGSVVEGDNGKQMVAVDITLSRRSREPVTVSYRTSDGTATVANGDYDAISGTLLFAPGETLKTVFVPVRGDRSVEPTEDFSIALEASANATLVRLHATITIVNDDLPPTIRAVGASVAEGNAGTSTAVITVTLSAAAIEQVSVAYSTADGTALESDSDYSRSSGTVVFEPGETSKTIPVVVLGDTRHERDETISVLLSDPVNATLSDRSAVVTIINDDAPGYEIVVVFPDNSLTAAQQAVFLTAAARWSEIIVADVPDAVFEGRTIDDVEIIASAPSIDGRGGTLGQAGPTALRPGSNLPYRGEMEFDSADVAEMVRDGSFENVIIHEMGHVIGIGTLWNSLGLVRGLGTANPTFVGANAVREYQTLSGTQATAVPVEAMGGEGTAGGHWRESVFGAELMTGFLNPGVNPISRLTIGSLQDIGYVVDYAAADPYTLNLRQTAANFQRLQSPTNRAALRFMLTASDNPLPALFAVAASSGADGQSEAAQPQGKSRLFRSIGAGRLA
jgi:hypothetical protein